MEMEISRTGGFPVRSILVMLLAFVALHMFSDAGPPNSPPRMHSIPRPGREARVWEWDKWRWCDYISNNSRIRDVRVCTGAGRLADLVDIGDVYEVAYDEDWEEALAEALLHALALDCDPGIFLLKPEGRTRYYMECQAVVQFLRQYDVPITLNSVVIPQKSYNYGRENLGDDYPCDTEDNGN